MFGVPELDNSICLQLSRQDLAQCVRVNKDWYRVATPYLWSNLTGGQKKDSATGFLQVGSGRLSSETSVPAGARRADDRSSIVVSSDVLPVGFIIATQDFGNMIVA
ncbi:MAG: hypothetical protein J3Q66DRAFT_404190 [Benniella sp.]|nr:MAG: hypothetical protein J3Q66DRAFT_404190 [Benniella sp.]